jgi:hypothetical protein
LEEAEADLRLEAGVGRSVDEVVAAAVLVEAAEADLVEVVVAEAAAASVDKFIIIQFKILIY